MTDFEGLPREFSSPVRYRILRELAQGGMGRVLEAEQFGADGFHKRVALKVIHRSFSSSPEFISMFVGEARLVAELVHPNIVQIYQLEQLEGTYYIVMELIQGINLQQLIDAHAELGRRLPPEMATFIASRVARGLEYAHGKVLRGRKLGVVHRDVSPKNILITDEGEVKLADFGVAKAAHFLESEEGEQVYGKIEYMSPEQATCQVTGPRSDIYSLGIVYYELLAGWHPLRRGDEPLGEILRRVIEADLPPITGLEVPARFTRVLARALQPEPNRRFASAGSMGRALERAIYEQGYGPTIVSLRHYVRGLMRERRKAG